MKRLTTILITLILAVASVPIAGSSNTAIAQSASQIFVLSPTERTVFTGTCGPHEWGTAFEDFPLKQFWEAFNAGRAPVPLNPNVDPGGWYELDGPGSQNHSILWIGESALGFALQGNAAQFDVAAQKALRLLELNRIQGHQRHEALGYGGFWEGGIAAMALAGLYAPQGSTQGSALLSAARHWWADHVAVLRALRMSDGQIGLVGARMAGGPGEEDSWGALSSAVTLQLVDPQAHGTLHPLISSLVTPSGQPNHGLAGSDVRWCWPRHVHRWIVLRAMQHGAIPDVPANRLPPPVMQDVYRWTDSSGRVNIATPGVHGFRPARWHVSWAPGKVLRIEIGDATAPGGGKGGPNGWPPPTPLNIPGNAQHVLGPDFAQTSPVPNPPTTPQSPVPQPPTSPNPPPSTGPGGYVRGQSVNIEKTGVSRPSIEANLAQVTDVGSTEISVSLFKKSYKVDISQAAIAYTNQSPASANDIKSGSFINMIGFLDEADLSLVRASNVRIFVSSSPSPTPTTPTSTPPPNPSPSPNPPPSPTPTSNPTPTPPPAGGGGGGGNDAPDINTDIELYPPDRF